MEDVFPPYDVFINHRGPDVKKTLASLIYHALDRHGLRVFLDQEELQVGDSLTPAIKSAIRSASVHIAIFSKTYAESAWCLDELVWMFGSDSTSTKIIPIFYDIEPSALRHVEKGAYATAFEEHRKKHWLTIERVETWINALRKAAGISAVVFETQKDDHGKRLKEIVEIVLEKVGREDLHVCEHPVGLRQAAEHFEKEVLSSSELKGTHVIGIVGLRGSGKSTLATHLYHSKRSQFERSCFLSDTNREKLQTLQQTLLQNLLRDKSLHIDDTCTGRTLLAYRLRGLRVLIVFEDIDNQEQIDNLLFVKDVLGNGSLILVTCRDESLLASSQIKLYTVKLLDEKHALELFCWHAFGHNKPLLDFGDMVEELVRLCDGFPFALKVLAGQLSYERDPRMWRKHLESLRKGLPEGLSRRIVMDSYESLGDTEKEAFLDVAHFLMGEETDLVERVLDGLNNDGFQCLQTLRRKCLVEFDSADIVRLRGAGVNWSIAKGSSKIRMHKLVRNFARQIGRQGLPLRLCCSSDEMISTKVSGYHGSIQEYHVRGIRRDEDHQLPVFLHNRDIYGLELLAVQNSTIVRKFNRVSGDLTWFRLGQFHDTLNPSPLSWSSFSNFIPSTLRLRSLRVLEVHGIRPQDFCNMFGDREPPSQLRVLDVTCTEYFGNVSTAGPSTAISAKQGSASETSESLQPPINLGQWFQAWLGMLNLKNLGKMVLQYIQGLKTLPIKFEEVRNLRHVDLSGCSDLEVLPDSFTKELLHLQYLALRDCRKLVFQDLGKISTLEYLDFEGCSMLWEMPKGTEAQKSLNYLNVLHTELRKLPEHLEELKYLEELYIGSSELTEIPSSLYNLRRLTELTLLGCTKLLFIDDSIEKLVHLESFRMHNCGVRALPETIAWMNMKILDVQNCPLDLCQLLGAVDSDDMTLDSSQVQGSIDDRAHPNRSSCLTDLIIRNCSVGKINIPQARSLFPKLEIVDLSSNRLLTEIGSLPGNLISLKLMNCPKLRTLAWLSNLKRLKVLDISGCVELETLNVKGLSSVEVIQGDGCWGLRNVLGLNLLTKLSCFQISTRVRADRVYSYFRPQVEGVSLLKKFASCTEASFEIKECYFTDVKLKGAISLVLMTDPNCKIEVAFLGRTYTTYSAGDGSGMHILMWTKDSEVFNDFKFSRDEVIRFDIKVPNSNPLSKAPLQIGFIIEAKNRLDMTAFLSDIFNLYL